MEEGIVDVAVFDWASCLHIRNPGGKRLGYDRAFDVERTVAVDGGADALVRGRTVLVSIVS